MQRAYWKIPLLIQGCALAESSGPRRLIFAPGRIKNPRLFIQSQTFHMLGSLDELTGKRSNKLAGLNDTIASNFLCTYIPNRLDDIITPADTTG